MKTKIVSYKLNIRNYPNVEKDLEAMALKGWILHKILMNSIFIFKKDTAKELTYSISLFETETFFSAKRKEEIREFEELCEKIGWTYCTSSNVFHIYYKDKNSAANLIHTDIEEEFQLMERIRKRERTSIILLMLLVLFQGGYSFGKYF